MSSTETAAAAAAPSASTSGTNSTSVPDFFATHPAPADLGADRAATRAFVARARGAGAPLVCVTSGGTTVPLERNTVRFIDNFSTGTRGAASAERFLAAGYWVIFLSRRGSVQPFVRHLGIDHDPDAFLDALRPTSPANNDNDGDGDGAGAAAASASAPPAGEGGLTFRPGSAEKLALLQRVLALHTSVRREGRSLRLAFTSVDEYIHKLRAVATELNPAGSAAMLYFAAAVSDFYVPSPEMAQHKMQSSQGPPTIRLWGVPKCLRVLREEWSPAAFTVSFKLETDAKLLIPKALGAIDKYGINCVVANLLQTRYDTAVVVTGPDPASEQVVLRRPGDDDGDGGQAGSAVVAGLEDAPQIEDAMIGTLVRMHSEFIAAHP